MKTPRTILAAIAAATTLATLAMTAAPAAANGVGDLYVATSAGVLELHVSTSSVVNTVPISPAPTALAFSPDGKQLYVVSDGAHITPIDIATLNTLDPIAMPGTVTALAFPSGQVLVGAEPARRKLVFVRPSGESVTETAELPGAGNLLAGDRHDPRVVVAEAGKSWLQVVDPATSTFKSGKVTGEIRAISIDRDRGAVLVATHGPDALVRVDLGTLAVLSTVDLPATPSGVASMADGAVASGGSRIWRFDGSTVIPWGTAKGEVLGLAVSDEGKALHVAEKDLIEVFDEGGKVERTLKLTGKSPSAMAPVTAGSSLFTDKGSAGAKTPEPAAPTTHAAGGTLPPTSALADIEQIAERPQVQGALAIGLLILVACWLLIRRHDRRTQRNVG